MILTGRVSSVCHRPAEGRSFARLCSPSPPDWGTQECLPWIFFQSLLLPVGYRPWSKPLSPTPIQTSCVLPINASIVFGIDPAVSLFQIMNWADHFISSPHLQEIGLSHRLSCTLWFYLQSIHWSWSRKFSQVESWGDVAQRLTRVQGQLCLLVSTVITQSWRIVYSMCATVWRVFYIQQPNGNQRALMCEIPEIVIAATVIFYI